MKRVLFFLASSFVIFPSIVTPPTLGQQNNSALADPQALVGQGKSGHFGIDYSFKGADGAAPTATLIQDAAGNLYGTTSSGGAGFGVVFKLDTAKHETVLHAFTGADGAAPHGALVMDGSGNLYGTTSSGGASGLGTVFRIDRSGAETVLHSFYGNPDGASPYAGLVMDSAGNLYGTTEGGGASGFGTIFKIDASGAETVLHSFVGEPTDGADPKAGLTMDADGNLYGTTFIGGSAGYGTAFKLDAANSETVLYNFTGKSDGGNPFGGLTRDNNGILYGTTEADGTQLGNRPYGCCKGVVYQLNGTTQNVLYTFTGGNDGGTPAANLVLSNGVLYGTTLTGGPGHNGTAFSVTIATGNETVLHGFTGKADGATPGAGLLMNSAGILYGTAAGGGRFQKGTVFQYKK